jgi:hypothetical protein
MVVESETVGAISQAFGADGGGGMFNDNPARLIGSYVFTQLQLTI